MRLKKKCLWYIYACFSSLEKMNMIRIVITAVMALVIVPVVYARSCIVNAGTQVYEVSSSVSMEEATVSSARIATVKVSSAVTETRRRTVALSSAGSLSTMPLGSVLILR